MKKTIFLFLLTCTACFDEPDCIKESSNLLYININRFDEEGAVERFAVKINSVQVAGLNGVFYAEDSISRIVVPLDPYAQQATIIIDSEIAQDTLSVSYDGFTRLISPDCGTERFILDLDVVSHTFDSLRATETLLTPITTSNYEIYY